MRGKLPQILGFGIILDIILFDQITKWMAMEWVFRPLFDNTSTRLLEWITNAPSRLPVGISTAVFPSLNWTMVWNEGVSFGMLQQAGIWPLVGIASVISIILTIWLAKSTSKVESIALGMIIGGAIGNTIDRFRFGAVVDFIDVYVGTYHWPAFNIADACITIGVIILLYHGLFMSDESETKQNDQ